MNKIEINNETYEILDTKEKITIADSFVVRQNKIGQGAGEAALFLGSKKNKTLIDFFGGRNFELLCFLLKKDLINFLNEIKIEYLKPEQPYKNKNEFSKYWGERFKKVNESDEILPFELSEHDNRDSKDDRLYAKKPTKEKGCNNYNLIREIALPNISYLSIIKIKSKDNKILFYFRLFLDYFGEKEHPSLIKEEVEEIKESDMIDTEKEQIVRARKGQGEYREKLLRECPLCPITLVTDDRLLIASHIKPWAKSDNKQKMDPKNGFMFTPTYDFLFDRGFITFKNDKTIKISPWLSKMTLSKLNLSPGKKYMHLPIEGREKYLEFHRTQIFKQ